MTHVGINEPAPQALTAKRLGWDRGAFRQSITCSPERPRSSLTPMSDAYFATRRTQVKRLPKRGHYDREVVHGILDEGCICHVGFSVDGQTYVVPTAYARHGEALYIHGSSASRMLRELSGEIDICLTVTLVDGYVLARSAFNHSLNYRSVMALGRARMVEGAEKLAALEVLTNHLVPGRWQEVRQPTEKELKATLVLALPLHEVSAKVRSGPPVDDEEDYALPVWAGTVPTGVSVGAAVADVRVLEDAPDFDVARLCRPGSAPL